MSDRLYCADIIKCEDFLYDDLDTLIQYATENASEFVTYSDVEVIEVIHGDNGLQITFKTVDDYDEDGNEIYATKVESFDIEYTQMMVTVRL